jgi:glycosyltransferase involved in cell wall biosynthesis
LHRNIGRGPRWRGALFWSPIERFCAAGTWPRKSPPKIDAFLTVNQSIADHLNRKYRHLPPAVIVKNAAMQPNRRQPTYDGRLHEAAGLEPSRKILLYQGGFTLHRGLDALVRAAPLLPEGWRLVMMGWGQFEHELRAKAHAVDPNSGRIRFIPPVPHQELPHWTAGAALGVIPYENVCLNHWFCTPNKLWEYPASGVPVLASPFPEMEKLIAAHGIGRLLADPISPRNIAQVVGSITEIDLTKMRENCTAFTARDNWSVYEKRLIATYEQLLGWRANANALHNAAPTAERCVGRMSSGR